MKGRWTIWGILLMVILTWMLGYSQITITSTDLPFQIGNSWVEYYLNDMSGGGIPVNLGNTGGGNTWTFSISQYPNGYTDISQIVDPAATPFNNLFPTADFAFFTNNDSGGVYAFSKNTSTELQVLGYGVVTSDTNMAFKRHPYEKMLVYPLTAGTSWTSDASDTLSLGSNLFSVNRTVSEYLVDAWGTITVPLGTYDCLRIRSINHDYYTAYMGSMQLFSDTTENVAYLWIGKNVGFLASVSGPDGSTNPNFTQASDVYFRVSSSTAIGSSDETVISQYELFQNFPNPFNPTTTIAFTLPKAEDVRFAVYNIAGQLVEERSLGHLSAGEHQIQFRAQNLPSGIYFYQIQAGSWKAIKQMILMK